ncbi:MAG: ABC transporter permease subunit [Sporolactobacillus sp.]
MNMYFHELRSLRKTTILWLIVLIALAALFLSIYPGMARDAEGFRKLLANYPAPVRAMLGINLAYITSVTGFYSMIFSFITLCGSIQAMNLGVSILSKEVRERTADFLLVKPVSRPAIVSSKLFAALTTLLATDVIYYAALLLMVHWVKRGGFDQETFLLINLSLFFLQLIFFAIGMVVSVFFNKIRSVLSISLGIIFAFYILSALLATGKEDQVYRYFLPFDYFNTAYIIQHTAYQASFLIIAGCIFVAAIAASYVIYTRKDIHSVS